MTTTSSEYECTIEQVREGEANLAALVERGVYPQALLDAFRAGMAQRTDA